MSHKPSNSVDQINCDLMAFYDFCKENRLTDEEIRQMCAPLFETVDKEKLKRRIRLCFVTITILVCLYLIISSEAVTWHLSAVGRIFLIKILPLWDWTHLKNEKCLVGGQKQANEPVFDCALCETVTNVEIVSETHLKLLDDNYIKLHRPALIESDEITGAFENSTLEDVIAANPLLSGSYPCKLSTNTNNGLTTVGKLAKRLSLFESHFVHFQNCAFEAVKAFRTVVARPKFLPAEISPIQYSWILISRNYNITKYKSIDLIDRIDIFVQFVGANYVRLVPRTTCEFDCVELNLEVAAGEALVFTSMWNLEYKPKESGRNVAVILEAH